MLEGRYVKTVLVEVILDRFTSTLTPILILAIELLFDEILHRLPSHLNTIILVAKIFTDNLNKPSHLRSILKVDVMDFHVVNRVVLWFVWIWVVHEALLLDRRRAHLG